MNRSERAQLATDTLRIVGEGGYQTADGRSVDIAAATTRCIEQTQLFLPEQLDQIAAQALPQGFATITSIEVVNETSLAGASRLVSATGGCVGVLNFASARNPGGGFQSGSQAQEESLARSSSLYASLTSTPATPFYEFHRREPSALYSDRIIFSPDCPVFRDDAGALLASPYNVSFLTSPAPNARALRDNAPELLPQVPAVLAQRANLVLLLALQASCEHLVLGAWGCGVFGNDPAMVASAFATSLLPGGRFHNQFSTVRFSILDTSPDQATCAAFRRAFQQLERNP